MYGKNILSERAGHCGRPKVTNVITDKEIENTILGNRFLTFSAIKQQIPTLRQVSTRTIRRRLFQMNLKARVPAKKPLLTLYHMNKRLEWATNHLHYNDNDWGKVVYSDESTFNMKYEYHRYVRRRPGERFNEDCVSKIRNRSVASVNVWGAFSGTAFTDLVLLPKRMKANDYIEVLQNNLLPRFLTLLPHGGYFLQDNCPIHKARLVSTWLHENNITNISCHRLAQI